MRSILFLIAMCSLLGCATIEDTFQSGGRQTASFDLQCAPEKLEMTVLNRERAIGGGWASATVGVRGCGKQTTYLWTRATRQWIRQSEVSTAE